MNWELCISIERPSLDLLDSIPGELPLWSSWWSHLPSQYVIFHSLLLFSLLTETHGRPGYILDIFGHYNPRLLQQYDILTRHTNMYKKSAKDIDASKMQEYEVIGNIKRQPT